MEGCGVRRLNYTDLDQMYRPGYIHISGNGNGNGNGNDRMMGGILASLFGKSQAWYDSVSRIQKELVVLQAEVSAFGKGIWDTIADTLASKTPAPTFVDSGFTKYDYTMEWALNHMKAILVTSNYEPADNVIASADLYGRRVRAMVEFAKKTAPEMAAQVATDRAKVEAGLVGSRMIAPAVAGEAAFVKSLEEQAGKLAFGIGGIGIAVAAVAALILFMQMGGGRRNNPVLSTSWNPGGLFSGKILGLPAPLVWGGGAFAAWQLLKPKSA